MSVVFRMTYDLSIKRCLIENNLIEEDSQIERFTLNEDKLIIEDLYNEIPEITLTNIQEARALKHWLNYNIKPKNILERLYKLNTNPEILCKTLEKYLRKNGSYCDVRSDTIFLILNHETDDPYSLNDALKLLDLEDIGDKYLTGEFITEHDCSLTNVYIKWSIIKKGWDVI